MLNLVNTISEHNTSLLPDSENKNRSADIYISHNEELVVIGYENNALVWFSRTQLFDMFLSRRVFESLKQGQFCRQVKLDDILSASNLTKVDLDYMCYFELDYVNTDSPVLSGCLEDMPNCIGLTGLDFADLVIELYQSVKDLINSIGTTDDFLIELNNDYQSLQTFDVLKSDMRYSREMDVICNKWRDAEFVKLSDRATIRKLYYDVCHFV